MTATYDNLAAAIEHVKTLITEECEQDTSHTFGEHIHHWWAHPEGNWIVIQEYRAQAPGVPMSKRTLPLFLIGLALGRLSTTILPIGWPF